MDSAIRMISRIHWISRYDNKSNLLFSEHPLSEKDKSIFFYLFLVIKRKTCQKKTEIMKDEKNLWPEKIDCLVNHDIRQSHPSAGPFFGDFFTLFPNREPVHRLRYDI